MKNVGLRGKIEKDTVVKRHATENVSLRGKIKIYTVMIKTKIIANSQRSARDLHGYDHDKDYYKQKRRNQGRALHGCVNEKALDESRDAERSWDQDSHGFECVYNDNVGVVSVCGKDEFRVDDIDYDGYLIIKYLVIKDVVNSKDDYNDNVSITNIEVVIEEHDVVVKRKVNK